MNWIKKLWKKRETLNYEEILKKMRRYIPRIVLKYVIIVDMKYLDNKIC